MSTFHERPYLHRGRSENAWAFAGKAVLGGVTDRVGREINPHVFSVAEFDRRRKTGDRFLTTVLSEPKIFVIGSEDDLKSMG